jgi:hypothetical protein
MVNAKMNRFSFTNLYKGMNLLLPALVLAATVWMIVPKYQLLMTTNVKDPMGEPGIWKIDTLSGKLYYCRANIAWSITHEDGEEKSKVVTYSGPVCYPQVPVSDGNQSIQEQTQHLAPTISEQDLAKYDKMTPKQLKTLPSAEKEALIRTLNEPDNSQ